MAYATTLKFAEESGLGLRIVDENVGTGDTTTTSFDLDYDNVVADSYTLSHAPSGSNAFTALTETTDFTLDKESGRIELTSAGLLAVGTDIIYATYWYIDNFNDAQIVDLLSKAQDEVDLITARNWEPNQEVTDYQNGWRRYMYPEVEGPYDANYRRPDRVILRNHPVLDVRNVYFLADDTIFQKVVNFVDASSSFTDITDNVNSIAQAPVEPFAATPAADDIIYFGMPQIFLGLKTVLQTVGVGTTVNWEYYDGSSWTALNITEVESGSKDFTAAGRFNWEYPYGWERTTVDGTNAYWVRGTCQGTYSTVPKLAVVTSEDNVQLALQPFQWRWESNGVVYLTDEYLLSGVQNIRVDYNYGASAVPGYIEELTVLLAAMRAYISTSGGSYDDATSYQLGSKRLTVGEQYVNIREVIRQFKTRVDEITNLIGKRFSIAVL